MDRLVDRAVRTADALIAELNKPVPEKCEHGIKDGDWCDPCSRAYRAAASDPDNHESA